MSSSRVDVVNVDGGGRGDTATTGMVSLRRELAKLHQQAALVEKSLEDQRRDRSDSLDRLERATERALTLEARLSALEAEASTLRKVHEASLAELQSVRAERDDLVHAVDAAKAATADLGKLRDELAQLRKTADEAAGTGDALVQAKQEAETARAEAEKARAETAQARAEAERAKKALDVAEGDAAMVGEQASKIRAEAAELRLSAEKAREELAKARADLARARESAEAARDEAESARADAAKARDDIAIAQAETKSAREELKNAREEAETARVDAGEKAEELTRAKEDNSRDRATARDRIDLLERALDDAREANTRYMSLLDAARENEDRLGGHLEAANARASTAEARAFAIATAHASLEESVRRLREDVAGAFARFVQDGGPHDGAGSPSGSDAASGSIAPQLVGSAPQEPTTAGAVVDEASTNASPASKSVPPPPPSPSGAPGPAPAFLPDADVTASPAPAHASMPAAARGSNPPPTRLSAPPPPTALPSADGWSTLESSPQTRRPGSSMPPPYHEAADLTSKTRQELLAKLVDPEHAEAAAAELRSHPEWLRSVPPPALIAALSSVDYDAEGTVFELARAWDREPLCHSLIAALRSESDMPAREHSAWLLKHLAAPSSWKAIADLARSDDEPVQLRRWLLEALDRLAAGRAIGWRELGDVVTAVARHPDASLRDGVVGILVSLDRSDEKRRLLLDILRADDDEVVLASAVNALGSVLPMELDPGLVDRLLSHPSPRVQRSVRDLIERARLAKG